MTRASAGDFVLTKASHKAGTLSCFGVTYCVK